MTSRQVRRERREGERKAKKAEIKRLKAASLAESRLDEAAFLSEPKIHKLEAALLSEPKTPSKAFVSQNTANIASAALPDPTPVAVGQSRLDQNIISEARFAANRANARLSTGPSTQAGRLASSRNSLKHGLASGTLIIPGEDPAAFRSLLRDLLEEHQPANPTEDLLIHEIAQSWWLSQRAIRLQNECFSEAGVDEKRLSLYLRYGTAHDRAFHKALNTLIRLKQNRARQQAASRAGFVSQSAHPGPQPSPAVSQNAPSIRLKADEAAFLSEPKTPTIGFVSQNETNDAPSLPQEAVQAA